MTGRPVDLVGGTDLGYAACIHDRHPIGYLGHDAEVMGDPHDRQPVLVLELAHQIDDLGLDGHVKGRGRLVGDKQLGLARKGHGDHGPLAHASGELVREVVHPRRGGRYANPVEELDRSSPGLGLREAPMYAEALADLATNTMDRVQRGHRLLEDHRHVPASESPQLPRLHADDLATLQPDGPGHRRGR